jgi:hypothetical protein
MVAFGIDHEGQWVNIDEDVANVVQTIQETWPMLRIQVFESDEKALVHPKTAPYQIIERVGDKDFFVMDVWELDHRIIEKLHRLDKQKRGVQTLEDIVLQENAKNRAELKKPWEERKELGADIITHMGKNPKGSYTFKDPDSGEVHKVSDD